MSNHEWCDYCKACTTGGDCLLGYETTHHGLYNMGLPDQYVRGKPREYCPKPMTKQRLDVEITKKIVLSRLRS